ncbi:MAG: aldehyde dehydrogenase [Lewinellaceae bacterium]|nr:aldehyde dehydrogenase [Saprospiraceae bacterium]MCB9313718.1 aldehyde dehydrogenase [Lewinellaceae bacterium]
MIQLSNYINGQQVPPLSSTWLDNYEPATGQVYSRIPDSDGADVETAYQAARAAFPAWSTTPLEERYRILIRVSELIDHHLEELAEAESRDNGKPVWLARKVDIPRASSNFRFFATGLMHFSSESHEMPGEAINYTLRQPIGVVGCISPWNLPLYLFSWKIAPALAAGNTVLAKPSEITPYTAWRLGEICMEAGLPPGVLNIVHGTGPRVGEAMVTHPGIKAISFTGGTATGARIAATAAPMFKKLSLELGGKNPTLIFADAEFEDVLRTTVQSGFANQGEICLCGSRILVERPIYEKFRDAYVEKISRLKVGDPTDPETRVGAIVSEAHKDKILSYIALAQEEGGRILCGGKAVRIEGRCANGWFIQPTVIEGLDQGCRTNQEEIFGPVVTIQPFDTEEEALAMANGVRYGLATTVWTSDLKRAHRVAARLESGIVWVNCWLLRDLRTPFGGMKDSGVGREGGWEAMRFFTEAKNVCIKL